MLKQIILAPLIGLGFGLMIGAVKAETMPVSDVSLVLAADISGSMSVEELKLQREAYAKALTHPDVVQAIREGPHGRIWLTYFEWSDCNIQIPVVKWTRIEGLGDLEAVAATILKDGRTTAIGNTCVSGALRYADLLLSLVPEQSERRIVDISGDGGHNIGEYPWWARDALVAKGVVINALPIVFQENAEAMIKFFTDDVIGGVGAFVEPARDFPDLERALRRKLVQEIG